MVRGCLISSLIGLWISDPVLAQTKIAGAPAGSSETRYCMHVAPVTGNLAETIQCWTRAEWADQGVDLDKEWSKEGVRTLG